MQFNQFVKILVQVWREMFNFLWYKNDPPRSGASIWAGVIPSDSRQIMVILHRFSCNFATPSV